MIGASTNNKFPVLKYLVLDKLIGNSYKTSRDYHNIPSYKIGIPKSILIYKLLI